MRALTSRELTDVSGGLEEVVVRGKRYKLIDPLRYYVFEDLGGIAGDGGSGGGGNSSGFGDSVIGHPVDLDPNPSSIKDATDYEKDWKAVFDKMSPAELKAFDAQLERDFKNAMDTLNFGLAGFLADFKDANGDPGKMGMASSRAAQNASPFTLGLIEAALTRAYAVAAALPGGI